MLAILNAGLVLTRDDLERGWPVSRAARFGRLASDGRVEALGQMLNRQITPVLL